MNFLDMHAVAIVGQRDYGFLGEVEGLIDDLLREHGEQLLIVSGGGGAVDRTAESYAKELRIPYLIFPANWLKWGKPAGPIRNRSIVENSDEVYAFVRTRKSKGTKNCVNTAIKNGTPVTVMYKGEWVEGSRFKFK